MAETIRPIQDHNLLRLVVTDFRGGGRPVKSGKVRMCVNAGGYKEEIEYDMIIR